jgi:2-dehydrotetronate isomerase
MLNFAANLSWMFKEWPFLDRFSAAADAGFRAVECLFPYEHKPDEIARCLARHNLKQVLFNLPPGDWARGERGLASLPDRREEFRASVKAALEYAQATGTGRVHVMSGIIAGDVARALATFRDSIAFACDAAAPDGIDVMIEPINSRDIPNYLMNDFHLAERLITDLKRPNLKLQFDIYHRQIIHGDVTRGLEALMPLIGHIQISSVPLRHEPGTGELDDRHVLQIIAQLNYAGYIGCEYQPAAGTLEGLGWMKRVAIAPA